MSLTRRYSAAMFAASVLLLGACGSETPVQPSPEVAETNDNPRNIFLDQSTFVFTDADGSLTGPQQLKVGGLVAIGSYVLFDNWVFSPAGTNWLRMSPTPEFQRDPLRWVFNLWVDPTAYASLADGVYSAHAHASVPAALNGPLGVTAVLCKGASCLEIGSNLVSALGAGDGTWQRGVDLDAPGGYFYEDYFLVIPPFTTAHITNEGSSCGAGQTLGDAYLYAFELDGNVINWNDDSLCGLNSYLPIHNGSGSSWTIRVRTTSFSAGDQGTYRLRVNAGPPFLMAPHELTPAEQEALRNKAARN